MPAQKQQAAARTRLVKEDIVEAIAGKSKGKRGRVLDIDRKNGGIAEREAYFDISNVMIVCPDDGPVRIGTQVSADGTRTRVCRKCGKPLEKKKAK